MAKYVAAAPSLGFTVDQITQGQNYPAAEVNQFVHDPGIGNESGLSEERAIKTIQDTVDTSNAVRLGEGSGFVYAYGYECLPDRLKVGSTESETVQRIAAQIGTSTPDKPALFLEIKTDHCRALERAIQAALELRGCKILGGGTEWFKTNRDEIIEIYKFINCN